MSRNGKIGVLLAAIAVAVVAFVLLQPGDDDKKDEKTTAAQTQTQTSTTGKQKPQEKPKPETPVEKIELEGGEPVGGTKEIDARTGEKVKISVSSDGEQELHLHGYDITREVAPDKPAEFDFKADAEGVFELEIHGSGAVIANVTVGS